MPLTKLALRNCTWKIRRRFLYPNKKTDRMAEIQQAPIAQGDANAVSLKSKNGTGQPHGVPGPTPADSTLRDTRQPAFRGTCTPERQAAQARIRGTRGSWRMEDGRSEI